MVILAENSTTLHSPYDVVASITSLFAKMLLTQKKTSNLVQTKKIRVNKIGVLRKILDFVDQKIGRIYFAPNGAVWIRRSVQSSA